MKRLFVAITILFICLTGQAQTLTTHSSCDTNCDNNITIEDVTNTTEKILKDSANETEVVTASQLNTVLKAIYSRLDQLEQIQTQIEVLKQTLSELAENAGTKTPAEIEEEINTNGYAYVDLGLSVRWATCNVGATTPEGYGNYYAWGETSTKTSYDWSSYTLCNNSSEDMKEYCTSPYYGKVDNKTTLDKSDDAASVNMGGAWRMPTNDEMDEIRTKCTWTWTNMNGINGYTVKGTNGGSIFLPAGGYIENSTTKSASVYGFYWTSSLNTSNPGQAYEMYINQVRAASEKDSRSFGYTIRAVLP